MLAPTRSFVILTPEHGISRRIPHTNSRNNFGGRRMLLGWIRDWRAFGKTAHQADVPLITTNYFIDLLEDTSVICLGLPL